MAAAAPAIQSVQVFGRKKTATAVCHCRKGHGIVTINGVPVQALEPVALRAKVLEPLMILGTEKFQDLDLRVRSNGGGIVAQIYAIRQSIAKAIVAFYQKYVDESEKKLIKDQLLAYDRSLLTTDSRRREPKKFGGPGARARFQKAYR